MAGMSITEMERAICDKLFADAKAQGLCLAVDDWDRSTHSPISQTADHFYAEASATDETTVVVLDARVAKQRRIGSLLLVFGNDGYDLLADHTSNVPINALVAGADALADELEAQS